MNKHKKTKRLVAIMLVFTMIFSLFSMTPASASVVYDPELDQVFDEMLDSAATDDTIAVQADSSPSEQVTTEVEGLNNIKNATVKAAVEYAFSTQKGNETQETITGLDLSTVQDDEWFTKNVIGGRLNINDIWPLFPNMTWLNVDSTNITSVFTNYNWHMSEDDPAAFVIEGPDKELVVLASDTFAISEADGGRHVIFNPDFIAEGLGTLTESSPSGLQIDMYEVFKQLRFAKYENGEYVPVEEGIQPWQYDDLFSSLEFGIRTKDLPETTMVTDRVNIENIQGSERYYDISNLPNGDYILYVNGVKFNDVTVDYGRAVYGDISFTVKAKSYSVSTNDLKVYRGGGTNTLTISKIDEDGNPIGIDTTNTNIQYVLEYASDDYKDAQSVVALDKDSNPVDLIGNPDAVVLNEGKLQVTVKTTDTTDAVTTAAPNDITAYFSDTVGSFSSTPDTAQSSSTAIVNVVQQTTSNGSVVASKVVASDVKITLETLTPLTANPDMYEYNEKMLNDGVWTNTTAVSTTPIWVLGGTAISSTSENNIQENSLAYSTETLYILKDSSGTPLSAGFAGLVDNVTVQSNSSSSSQVGGVTAEATTVRINDGSDTQKDVTAIRVSGGFTAANDETGEVTITFKEMAGGVSDGVGGTTPITLVFNYKLKSSTPDAYEVYKIDSFDPLYVGAQLTTSTGGTITNATEYNKAVSNLINGGGGTLVARKDNKNGDSTSYVAELVENSQSALVLAAVYGNNKVLVSSNAITNIYDGNDPNESARAIAKFNRNGTNAAVVDSATTLYAQANGSNSNIKAVNWQDSGTTAYANGGVILVGGSYATGRDTAKIKFTTENSILGAVDVNIKLVQKQVDKYLIVNKDTELPQAQADGSIKYTNAWYTAAQLTDAEKQIPVGASVDCKVFVRYNNDDLEVANLTDTAQGYTVTCDNSDFSVQSKANGIITVKAPESAGKNDSALNGGSSTTVKVQRTITRGVVKSGTETFTTTDSQIIGFNYLLEVGADVNLYDDPTAALAATTSSAKYYLLKSELGSDPLKLPRGTKAYLWVVPEFSNPDYYGEDDDFGNDVDAMLAFFNANAIVAHDTAAYIETPTFDELTISAHLNGSADSVMTIAPVDDAAGVATDPVDEHARAYVIDTTGAVMVDQNTTIYVDITPANNGINTVVSLKEAYDRYAENGNNNSGIAPYSYTVSAQNAPSETLKVVITDPIVTGIAIEQYNDSTGAYEDVASNAVANKITANVGQTLKLRAKIKYSDGSAVDAILGTTGANSAFANGMYFTNPEQTYEDYVITPVAADDTFGPLAPQYASGESYTVAADGTANSGTASVATVKSLAQLIADGDNDDISALYSYYTSKTPTSYKNLISASSASESNWRNGGQTAAQVQTVLAALTRDIKLNPYKVSGSATTADESGLTIGWLDGSGKLVTSETDATIIPGHYAIQLNETGTYQIKFSDLFAANGIDKKVGIDDLANAGTDYVLTIEVSDPQIEGIYLVGEKGIEKNAGEIALQSPIQTYTLGDPDTTPDPTPTTKNTVEYVNIFDNTSVGTTTKSFVIYPVILDSTWRLAHPNSELPVQGSLSSDDVSDANGVRKIKAADWSNIQLADTDWALSGGNGAFAGETESDYLSIQQATDKDGYVYLLVTVKQSFDFKQTKETAPNVTDDPLRNQTVTTSVDYMKITLNSTATLTAQNANASYKYDTTTPYSVDASGIDFKVGTSQNVVVLDVRVDRQTAGTSVALNNGGVIYQITYITNTGLSRALKNSEFDQTLGGYASATDSKGENVLRIYPANSNPAGCMIYYVGNSQLEFDPSQTGTYTYYLCTWNGNANNVELPYDHSSADAWKSASVIQFSVTEQTMNGQQVYYGESAKIQDVPTTYSSIEYSGNTDLLDPTLLAEDTFSMIKNERGLVTATFMNNGLAVAKKEINLIPSTPEISLVPSGTPGSPVSFACGQQINLLWATKYIKTDNLGNQSTTMVNYEPVLPSQVVRDANNGNEDFLTFGEGTATAATTTVSDNPFVYAKYDITNPNGTVYELYTRLSKSATAPSAVDPCLAIPSDTGAQATKLGSNDVLTFNELGTTQSVLVTSGISATKPDGTPIKAFNVTSSNPNVVSVVNSGNGIAKVTAIRKGDATLTFNIVDQNTTKTLTLNVNVDVLSATKITVSGPSSQTVIKGSDATFTVTAIPADGMTYQWQISTNNGDSWADITDNATATTASLTIPAVVENDNGKMFRCRLVVGDAAKDTDPATLTVKGVGITVKTQPSIDPVTEGENATLSFATEGVLPGAQIQWQVSTDNGTTWTDITDNDTATTQQLVLTAVNTDMNGNQYRARITDSTNADFVPVVTDAATLTVKSATTPGGEEPGSDVSITVTTQPQSSSVVAGSDVELTVAAEIAGSEDALSYQWQTSTNGTTWTNVSGETTATLKLTGVTVASDNGKMFRCVVTGGGATATSDTAALTVTAAPLPEGTYTITVVTPTNGTLAVDKTTATKDEQVKVTVTPNTNYKLKTLTVGGTDVTSKVSGNTYTFAMPEKNIAISAAFTASTTTSTGTSGSGGGGGGSTTVTKYTLTFQTNGGTSISNASYASGTTVNLASFTTTRTGYTFDGWYTESALTNKVTSVTMTKNTTVYAKWAAGTSTSTPSQGSTGTNGSTGTTGISTQSFTDVTSDGWYSTAVNWAVSNGITKGVSATSFAPNMDCTRAQIVTFLWRAMGSPEPTITENPFTDVSEGDYYKAILWAVEKGITQGVTDTTFVPDAICTRAQIVTFLWRAMGSPEATATDSGFADVPASAYYAEAVIWAVENGVTKGVSATEFAPDMDCTRAQVVTFLYNAMKTAENAN